MDKQQLLDMPLHSVVDLGMHLSILKVLGGWMYIFKCDKGITSTFISSRGKD